MKKPMIRTCRLWMQIGVAVAFILIAWLNHLRINFVLGNFLSFRFLGLPLADPLAVLQITLKNNYLSYELLLGAGIALAIAAIFGTVFCSWVCPFGLLSELGYVIAHKWRKRRYHRKVRLHRWGFGIKLVLFFVGIGIFLVFSTTPVLNQLSLPAWYSRIFQFWFEQRHISLALVALVVVIAIEALTGRRLWCRYVCPQSVMITLAKQVNPRRLRVCFDSCRCICKGGQAPPCARSCSLNLNPKQLNFLLETECTNCGDCVAACRKRGQALIFGFGKITHYHKEETEIEK